MKEMAGMQLRPWVPPPVPPSPPQEISISIVNYSGGQQLITEFKEWVIHAQKISICFNDQMMFIFIHGASNRFIAGGYEDILQLVNLKSFPCSDTIFTNPYREGIGPTDWFQSSSATLSKINRSVGKS